MVIRERLIESLPSHVKISSEVGELIEDSILLCEQIRVIDKKRLVRRIGNIGEENLRKVDTAFKVILDLE